MVYEHITGDAARQANDAPKRPRWTDCLPLRNERTAAYNAIHVGVLPGQGIGPEVVRCALDVLEAVASPAGVTVELRYGGAIGHDAQRKCGRVLPDDVIQFCEEVFAHSGAIVNGAAGGRYVYEIRRQFDLFFKISPIRVLNGLGDASRLKPEALRGVDILITRENTGGAYQGRWNFDVDALGHRQATHSASYSEPQVRRFLQAAARLARQRRGELTIVWKEAGIPAISTLWRECAEQVAAEHPVRYTLVDIDLMTYRLIQTPSEFDVIAAPNLFGDVLGDLAAVLLGSRGLSYSGNFNASGHAVYQTNHGAAYDLAGTDRANPVGQILSIAMMLRESFLQWQMADAIEQAVRQVWRQGFRTADVATAGTHIIGTREMGERVARQAVALIQLPSKSDCTRSHPEGTRPLNPC
jgi:3-isopropylmalate dehydrogenase